MILRDKSKIKNVFLVLLINSLIFASLLPYENALKNKDPTHSREILYNINTEVLNTNLIQVNIPFLHIDGNWTATNATYSWMTGKGTKDDPFLIQNIIINGGNIMSCVLINNSHNVYFTIENCVFHNSGYDTEDAGIYLENSDRGTLINNNCSYNQNGIYLKNSYNITISKNIIHNNSLNGLFFNICHNNYISQNVVYNNSIHALYLENTNYTKIQLNDFKESQNGSKIKKSYNNTLIENIFAKNSEKGLIIEDQSRNNSLYKNYFINNTLHAIDNGVINEWNSSFIGNYWDNYTDKGGIDANDDGIGEMTYQIGGMAISKDYRPIFGNPFHDGSQLYINGTATNGNHSWIWLSTRAYGSGFGTEAEPFKIKNLRIDSVSEGISILVEKSSAFFMIEDCKITNSENAGILLNNTKNGNIVNNNCSSNDEEGIFLYNCENNTLENNQITFNNITGILLYNSNNITISRNFLTNNTEYGIFLFNSDNNTILRNQIKNQGILGIALNKDSSWNLIYYNTFVKNGIQAMDNGTHNQWYIINLGNYWDDYTGEDIDDNGIGDSPYYIPGTADSIDLYPIWDDGIMRVRTKAGIVEVKEKTASGYLIKFLKANLIQVTIYIILIESIFVGVIVFNKFLAKKKEKRSSEFL